VSPRRNTLGSGQTLANGDRSIGLGQFSSFVAVERFPELSFEIAFCQINGLLLHSERFLSVALHELDASDGVQNAGVFAIRPLFGAISTDFSQLQITLFHPRVGGSFRWIILPKGDISFV